uniref:Uncharacterized protein n=1 Tax=Cannabis sativa TaxID=3483 RepID=A0A803PU37_CANSA
MGRKRSVVRSIGSPAGGGGAHKTKLRLWLQSRRTQCSSKELHGQGPPLSSFLLSLTSTLGPSRPVNTTYSPRSRWVPLVAFGSTQNPSSVSPTFVHMHRLHGSHAHMEINVSTLLSLMSAS